VDRLDEAVPQRAAFRRLTELLAHGRGLWSRFKPTVEAVMQDNRIHVRALTHLLAATLLATLSTAIAAADTDAVEPFNLFGNTWYVGTKLSSSVLVTSDYGHVLIDTGPAKSAPRIAANIEQLGFQLKDVKAILHAHATPDHVGGIAQMQRLTGAQVYARRPANELLSKGRHAAKNVWVVHDDQLLGVGSVRLRAIATPGNAEGGTSWIWDACDPAKKDDCLAAVYTDSPSPMLLNLECELLITAQPEASGLFERVARRPADQPAAIKDAEGCRHYAQSARDSQTGR
jgi:metallo-beta-lactamase class B